MLRNKKDYTSSIEKIQILFFTLQTTTYFLFTAIQHKNSKLFCLRILNILFTLLYKCKDCFIRRLLRRLCRRNEI